MDEMGCKTQVKTGSVVTAAWCPIRCQLEWQFIINIFRMSGTGCVTKFLPCLSLTGYTKFKQCSPGCLRIQSGSCPAGTDVIRLSACQSCSEYNYIYMYFTGRSSYWFSAIIFYRIYLN
jgi:hypothetical protein